MKLENCSTNNGIEINIKGAIHLKKYFNMFLVNKILIKEDLQATNETLDVNSRFFLGTGNSNLLIHE